MNTIMAIVLKVLFPHGLSLSYILIHSVIFQNGPTNVSNSGKRVSILCRVPPLLLRQGLGCNNFGLYIVGLFICTKYPRILSSLGIP